MTLKKNGDLWGLPTLKALYIPVINGEKHGYFNGVIIYNSLNEIITDL